MRDTGLRPLSVGEVLDVAVKLYMRNFLVLVKATAVVLVPVYVLQALIQLSLPTAHGNPFLGTPTGPSGSNVAWTFAAALIVEGLVLSIAGVLAIAAAFKALSDAYLDHPPTWQGSLRFALSRIAPLLWIGIEALVLVSIGLVLFVLPGIWLAVALSVAIPVLMLEGTKGRRALRRSRKLVKGRWWPTLATLAAALLLQAVIGAMVGGIIGGVAGGLAGGSGTVVVLAHLLAVILVGVAVTPFRAAVVTVIYFDLRVRKEGFDLQLLAEGIGHGPPASTAETSFGADPWSTGTGSPTGPDRWDVPPPDTPSWP
ncbi:MAG: glycerophosphoryl diester phosphodiesterase membrane domain-containing protein [Actinomycetota bacterium]|nr:glycerophosphoryl diester phosphodiesterase membrane domain-containing protein [Actinomycetota bacterium]